MSLPQPIKSRLTLPAVCAPMFLVTTPELVREACLAGVIGDDFAQSVHQHAQRRCRDLPAQLDDPEHAPGHFPAHRLRQARQVHPSPPGPVVTERARVLRRDT